VPTEAKQSGNCLHCHASIMPLYRKLGKAAAPQAGEAEQIQKGLSAVGDLGYWDAHKELEQVTGGKAHPVSCVDCHDPASMEVRITRPAFITGIQKLAASTADVAPLPSIERWRKGGRARPYDPNVDATRQEKRTYVCAQCHVEYFCGKGTTIFFPWAEGLKVEEMERLYDGLQVKGQRFKDWTHAETGMEVLKASTRVRDVEPGDSRPERRFLRRLPHVLPPRRLSEDRGTLVRSPLLSANRSCASCHPYNDEELKGRVEAIQDRHFALMSRAGQASVAMLDAIVAVRRPYDEQNRPAAAAKARESLEKNSEFLKLAKADQETKLAAETKANLLPMWRAVVRRSRPSRAGRAFSAPRNGASTTWRRRTPWASTRRRRWPGFWPSRSTCPVRRRSRPARSRGAGPRCPPCRWPRRTRERNPGNGRVETGGVARNASKDIPHRPSSVAAEKAVAPGQTLQRPDPSGRRLIHLAGGSPVIGSFVRLPPAGEAPVEEDEVADHDEHPGNPPEEGCSKPSSQRPSQRP